MLLDNARKFYSRITVAVPIQFILAAITRCRLEEVTKHLLLSRLPIVKIASLCNFNDLAYLGRLFRKRYGMTMREYRTSAPGEHAGTAPARCLT